MSRFQRFVDEVRKRVLDHPGTVDPSVRRAVSANEGVPADLSAYVEKVHRHAYKVTDEDVADLKRTYSEDQLFEVTVAAAVGASLLRLEAGLAPLRRKKS